MFRLGLRRILPVQTSLNRFIRNYRLTQNEISAGLKPLVIKIHPDLFANYPDIQVRTLQTTGRVVSGQLDLEGIRPSQKKSRKDVNSTSLASLQQWLDQLNDHIPSLPKLGWFENFKF